MLGIWIGTWLLALVPELHHFIHHDSQGSHHECAVTLVQKGHFVGPLLASFVVVLFWHGLRPILLRGAEPSISAGQQPGLSRAPPGLSLASR